MPEDKTLHNHRCENRKSSEKTWPNDRVTSRTGRIGGKVIQELNVRTGLGYLKYAAKQEHSIITLTNNGDRNSILGPTRSQSTYYKTTLSKLHYPHPLGQFFKIRQPGRKDMGPVV
jgi:hypothetical protein